MTNKFFTCIGRGHGAPALPATREQWEAMRQLQWLKDMCERIRRGDEKLKRKLPIWTPSCAEFKNNHRAVKDAVRPLARLMMDFDQKGHSKEILAKAMQLNEEGKWEVLLVEESVRRGTHVLITLPKDMTPQEAQERFSADVGFQADPALKDVARCIYMVPQKYTLFVSEKMFEEIAPTPTLLTQKTLPLTPPQVASEAFRRSTECASVPREGSNPHCDARTGVVTTSESEASDTIPSPCGRAREGSGGSEGSVSSSYPSTYQAIPYPLIIEVLEEQMGGTPEHGSRNNFIFSMACHLRYICDDDPEWIAKVLPTYGESRDKWMATIRSACNRNQTKRMPRIMERTLEVCKSRMGMKEEQEEVAEQDADTPPPMPKNLPPLIKLLISRTPDIYKAAVAHAVFPALATHLWQTRFRYIDNVEHEATLMNVLMAGTGAGKNCIAEPINRIMKDIRERDQENLRREREWKQEMQTKGANKDKRQRPEGLVIQEIDPDMTNAAFVQRLADAEERFLYAKMNEIDQFDALKTSSRSKAHFQIMCLAFDPDNVYGQTRVGTSSVSERVCIRFNWNASTTVQKGKRYFSQVLTDGPISRINFCTIPEREIGSEMPVYGTYDEQFDEQLRPYLLRLSEARGEIQCHEARTLATTLMKECADFSRLSQSRVYENLSFRANVIAYLKAMVLYVAQGERWDKRTEDFIRWSLHYDLWCKMHFFGESIEYAETIGNKKDKPGPQNLLDLLPNVFTREEAHMMRQRMDIKTGNITYMLSNWKKRGYIELHGEEMPQQEINKQCYRKSEKYLKSHLQQT